MEKKIQKKMNLKWFNFIKVLGLIIFFMSSCSNIKYVAKMQSNDAEYSDYQYKNQSLRFVGMIHIGQPGFYENVRRLITKSKQEGYVLGYEYVDFSELNEEQSRKVRKIVGFIPSEAGYKSLTQPLQEKGYAVQNNESFFHLVNDKDYKLDISSLELLQEYEKKYGPIVLEKEDLTTPLDKPIKKTLPKKNQLNIILNYRNERLAAKIDSINVPKLILIYGAKHEKGLIADLKKTDPKTKLIAKKTTKGEEGFFSPLPKK
jgi:hypothetical protein